MNIFIKLFGGIETFLYLCTRVKYNTAAKDTKKAENNEFYNLKVNKAMNIKEFRTLTGQEVTESEFEDINKLYMATGNMDKQTFCGLWKKNDLFRIALEVERNLSAKVTFAERCSPTKSKSSTT